MNETHVTDDGWPGGGSGLGDYEDPIGGGGTGSGGDPCSPTNEGIPIGCQGDDDEAVFLGQIDASDLDNYPIAKCIYQKSDQTKTIFLMPFFLQHA